MLKKIAADKEQLHNDDKAALKGHSQKKSYEAPIQPIEKLPKLGKNKYGLFETQITPDIDEEINRLKCEGLDSRRISAELAKQGAMITWQRVQKRFSFKARKMPVEIPQSPVTGPKSPWQRQPYPAKMPVMPSQAEHLSLSSDLTERIFVLTGQKLSPHSISDVLEEEIGAILSECQIIDIIVRRARGEI